MSASPLVEEGNESLTAAKQCYTLAASFPPQTGGAALHDLLNNIRDGLSQKFLVHDHVLLNVGPSLVTLDATQLSSAYES